MSSSLPSWSAREAYRLARAVASAAPVYMSTDSHNRDLISVMNDSWYHAINKVRKVLNRYRNEPHIDQSTGRCLRRGRKRNVITKALVRRVQEINRTASNQHSKVPDDEIGQLSLLKEMVTAKYTKKAGLNIPEIYKPGESLKDDAKMLNAAAFFIESESRSGNHTSSIPIPRDTNEKKDKRGYASDTPLRTKDSRRSIQKSCSSSTREKASIADASLPIIQKQANHPNLSHSVSSNYHIEQALLKMNTWAHRWLSGEIGHTDSAWESFEFCLQQPQIFAKFDTSDQRLKAKAKVNANASVYQIPAKRKHEEIDNPVENTSKATSNPPKRRWEAPVDNRPNRLPDRYPPLDNSHTVDRWPPLDRNQPIDRYRPTYRDRPNRRSLTREPSPTSKGDGEVNGSKVKRLRLSSPHPPSVALTMPTSTNQDLSGIHPERLSRIQSVVEVIDWYSTKWPGC